MLDELLQRALLYLPARVLPTGMKASVLLHGTSRACQILPDLMMCVRVCSVPYASLPRLLSEHSLSAGMNRLCMYQESGRKGLWNAFFLPHFVCANRVRSM